jgi:hypothetical protein
MNPLTMSAGGACGRGGTASIAGARAYEEFGEASLSCTGPSSGIPTQPETRRASASDAPATPTARHLVRVIVVLP